MNNYYPLKWVRDKIGNELTEQIVITPGESRSWSYMFADESGEFLIVKANAHHNITSVIFTPKFRSVGISLKIHKKK